MPLPDYQRREGLPANVAGYYYDKTAYISSEKLGEAQLDANAAWDLMLIKLHEDGHHLDYLLRNYYSDAGNRADGEIGSRFATTYVAYNNLLSNDLTINIGQISGGSYSFNTSGVDLDAKAGYLLNDNYYKSSAGNIDGVDVEMFSISPSTPIHENINKTAMIAAYRSEIDSQKVVNRRILTDEEVLDRMKFLDPIIKGSEWNDAPCKDMNAIEVCRIKTVNSLFNLSGQYLAAAYADAADGMVSKNDPILQGLLKPRTGDIGFETHEGRYQIWHAMTPNSDLTNGQVRDLIVDQLTNWYIKAQKYQDTPLGVFYLNHIGHTIGDSYSGAHALRNAQLEITSFHNYETQDHSIHSQHDGPAPGERWDEVPGVKHAIKSNAAAFTLYRNRATPMEFQSFLRDRVFNVSPGALNVQSGQEKLKPRF